MSLSQQYAKREHRDGYAAEVHDPRAAARCRQLRADVDIAQQVADSRQHVMGEHPDKKDRRSSERNVVKETSDSRVGLRALERQVEKINPEWNAERQENSCHPVSD